MVKDLLPSDPAKVGPYHLLGRLGAGGMGQVFLARSPGGRLVAVKVIRPELAGESGFRARFAREVAAARNVSGMFTALVVDAEVDGQVPWLATAYVAGPSLAEAMEDQGPLPVLRVRQVQPEEHQHDQRLAGRGQGRGTDHGHRARHGVLADRGHRRG
jgi:eukaryotic-like serine/threonine-protein kinase